MVVHFPYYHFSERLITFLNGPFLASFVICFQAIFTSSIVDFSRIRSRIVGVEGEHADDLNFTTAQCWTTYLWLVQVEAIEQSNNMKCMDGI